MDNLIDKVVYCSKGIAFRVCVLQTHFGSRLYQRAGVIYIFLLYMKIDTWRLRLVVTFLEMSAVYLFNLLYNIIEF